MKIAKSFLPAADEVQRLERGRGPVRSFYKKIAKRHIKRLGTTQGTYVVTPSGKLLGSRHPYDKDSVAGFLKSCLNKYKKLSKKERLGSSINTKNSGSTTPPEGGLILSVVLRKPNSRKARGSVAWNQDFAWYRKEEAKGFLPSNPRKGRTHEVPRKLVERLARFHLSDTVRAWANPYPAKCVKEARLTATVLEVKGSIVTLRFNGAIHSEQKDTPKYGSSKDRGRLPRKPYRYFKGVLRGYATFDLKYMRFTKFELVAYGKHEGGGERGASGKETMGAAMTLVVVRHLFPNRSG